MSAAFVPMRQMPAHAGYKPGDVLVVFGELFNRGYANGIVEEAEKAGLTIVRSTVGRRDSEGNLRALTAEELANWPKPYINIPLEAGFDMEPAQDGTSPVDQLTGVKMNEWDQVKLDWDRIRQSRQAGVERFRRNVTAYMEQLEKVVPENANVIFLHTMAGGVPRAKVLMPTMNKVFKGVGERNVSSKVFWDSEMGRLCEMTFEEVTANTFQHLIELSGQLRARQEKNGARVRYAAYGYHGTEVLINDQYQWQSYSPYVQGWAKMKLESIARDAWKAGIKASVYNCPEILTNSTTIFVGVEIFLYQLVGALRKEAGNSPYVKNVVAKCESLFKDGHNFDEIIKANNEYLTSDLIRRFNSWDQWPMHSGKEQMEKMINLSERIFDMHKDQKNLATFILSEEVFKSCGYVMFNESWEPREPVWWLGHDILAKHLVS